MRTPAPPTADQWRSWRVDPSWSRFLDVPSHDGGIHRWHVLERSPASPVGTVVCVHGNPTWSYLWRSVLEQLGDRYRVVAVDQLGMGFSQRVGLRRYADRVRDLSDVIDALEIDGPIIIAGQDWGGAVSMGWAVESADRLAGMVLCNTGIAVPTGRKAPWLIRLAAAGPMTDLVGRRTRAFVDGTLGLSWSRIPKYARAGYRGPYRSADTRGAIAEFVADVPFTDRHPSSAAIARVAERLSTVTAPVLLAWGSADPVFDDSFALDLAARMPHADRHRYPGIGHLAIEEADVAGAMDAWIHDRIPSAGEAQDAAPLAAAVGDAGLASATPATEAAQTAGDANRAPLWSALVARSSDSSTAFVDGATRGRVSFKELHDRVMGIAAGLAAHGLKPGDRVAMLVPPSIDLVAAVYGVWRAGGVTVIADRGLGLRGLGRAVRGARVDWVIGQPNALAAAKALRWAPLASTIAVGERTVLGAVATLGALSAGHNTLPPEPSLDDPAAVLYTSGATGPAKGVRYRHGQLAAQRDALAATYDISAADRLVAAFAPFALYGPALGIASTIPNVDVTKPGSLTAAALGEACVAVEASIVFASPAALANVVATSQGLGSSVRDRFAAVRLVLSAGAPVPTSTLQQAERLFPLAGLHTPYGMTECLPIADISLTERQCVGDGVGVCVGLPVDGAAVRIAPLGFSAAAPLQDVNVDVTGEVLVRAPWVSDGYDQLWRTQRDARPVADDGEVWHRSGDVGHLDLDGRLWIEGRSVHVISQVDGPVTPVPIEVAVERLPGIERCAAVGVGPENCQQLVVVVEQRGAPHGVAAERVARQVRGALDRPVAAVLTVEALPVDIRHNTKIDRTAVASWATQLLSGAKAKPKW